MVALYANDVALRVNELTTRHFYAIIPPKKGGDFLDFIIDVLVEVVFEAIAEGFMMLSEVFVPNQTFSAKARKILTIVFSLLALVLFFVLVLGILLLAESRGGSSLGWIFVILGGGYILMAVILKIIAVIKR